jgi:flagellar assembly protein FliH
MLTDAAFSKLSFPSIGAARSEEEFEHARTRGHAAGYAAGLRQAALAAEALRDAAEADNDERASVARVAVLSALRALDSAREQVAAANGLVLAAADAALAAAALDLAEAIIGRELDDAETSAKAAVSRALSGVAPDEVVALRLHPDDIAVLGADAGQLAGLHVVADPSLARGDAIVTLPDGSVDARIASALERARAVLLGGQS